METGEGHIGLRDAKEIVDRVCEGVEYIGAAEIDARLKSDDEYRATVALDIYRGVVTPKPTPVLTSNKISLIKLVRTGVLDEDELVTVCRLLLSRHIMLK